MASCLLSPNLTREGIYTVFLKEFDKQSLIRTKAKTAGTVQPGGVVSLMCTNI